MINFHQFKTHVVIPTLKYLEDEIPYSEEAVDLLMLTAGHESKGGRFLRQVGVPEGVGAYGIYQMEMATHDDIYENFLEHRPSLAGSIITLVSSTLLVRQDLVVNLAYATAMARVHYWRVKEALPKKDDSGYLDNLGKYAKQYYNTHEGKATSSKYVTDYLVWRDA